jgi:hypothetical protein
MMMPETIHIFHTTQQYLYRKNIPNMFFIVPTCNSIGPYADSDENKKEKQSNLIKHFLCHEITQKYSI